MKRRIQHIIVLALLANFGLISFQVYWLRNNYLINKANFEKDIREGLEEAIESLMFGRTKALVLLEDSIKFTAGNPLDTNLLTEVFSFSNSKPRSSANIRIQGFQPDTVKKHYSTTAVINIRDSAHHHLNQTLQFDTEGAYFLPETQDLFQKVFLSLLTDRLNLEKLDSTYQVQLNKRFLNSPFELELFERDSLLDAYSSSSDFKREYTTQTTSTLLPPWYKVEAHFPQQTLFLIKKMGYSLVISFLLIAIMLASFFYMLNIIFQQKQLAEIKNDFINNMTHELKTPISILSTANEALLNFKALEDKNKTLRYLGIFQKELDRLTTMVEKVLNISVYEKESFTLKRESIDLSSMLEDLIQQHQVPRDKPIDISFENHLQNAMIKVDRVHFYNVLNNLFDNAIKYSREHIIIKVRAYERQNSLFVEVEDQGIGISKVHQKSIFDKFYRVPTGNIHNVKGFGLGLNYVKRIIEKHNGSINLRSELNQGSTFTISLPRS